MPMYIYTVSRELFCDIMPLTKHLCSRELVYDNAEKYRDWLCEVFYCRYSVYLVYMYCGIIITQYGSTVNIGVAVGVPALYHT